MTSFATNKFKISTLEPKFYYQPYKKSYINQLLQYDFTSRMDSCKPSKKTKSHFRVWLRTFPKQINSQVNEKESLYT